MNLFAEFKRRILFRVGTLAAGPRAVRLPRARTSDANGEAMTKETNNAQRALGLAMVLALSCAAQAQPSMTPDTSMQPPILEFDFPGMEIGIAEYPHGPTGTTVFHFPERAKAAIDVRGGSPGSIQSSSLRAMYEASYTNAVVFAGGSSYGLAAATGAADAIRDRAESPGDWRQIAFVPGAIIYDLGSRRLNAVVPDAELGRAALESAVPGRFPLGAQGAGRFAMQGWFFDEPQHSGQGGAIRTLGDVRVAVFTVVNSIGAIVDRTGRVVRCGQSPGSGCPDIHEHLGRRMAEIDEAIAPPAGGPTANTTLTLLVVNVDLPVAALKRLAMQVHGSMSRAIQPFSTLNDGDTLIALTTGELPETALDSSQLGVLASETAWDAVLASVPQLPSRTQETPIEWSAQRMDAVAGTYRFSRFAALEIAVEGGRLIATGPEVASLYFPASEAFELIPNGEDEVAIDHGDRYRMRLVRDGAKIRGLYLGPGPWQQYAEKVGTDPE